MVSSLPACVDMKLRDHLLRFQSAFSMRALPFTIPINPASTCEPTRNDHERVPLRSSYTPEERTCRAGRVARRQSGPAAEQGSARTWTKRTRSRSLGYVHDAKKVDANKVPQFKPGSNCANCAADSSARRATSGGRAISSRASSSTRTAGARCGWRSPARKSADASCPSPDLRRQYVFRPVERFHAGIGVSTPAFGTNFDLSTS